MRKSENGADMDTSRALEIIRALGDGVHPFTDEAFPMGSAYQHPEVVRALFKAVYALQVLRQREKRQAGVPENAGKAWGEEEDAQLLAAVDAGMTITELTARHKRTSAAIQARLLRLGKEHIPPTET